MTLIVLLSILLFYGCSETKDSEKPIEYTYQVVKSYPHDSNAFTQGLVFENGLLYEGTGLYGSSTLRLTDLETGQILKMHNLSDEYFGEGITIFKDKIYQLTYRSNIGFVYDKNSFELLKTFNYPTECWGITHDDNRLIISDGSSTLYFFDPESLEQTGSIKVCDREIPVSGLNELEYVKGQIFANVWPTERIAIIEPNTGQVIGWVYMNGLLNQQEISKPIDVLNGIAYDAANDRLFVTGKFWPKLFEIKLVPLK
ncbi:MAG: glutamine cyclotransferase [Planctomycetes bacterium RBG_13_46_10]|nr:MAG: glutamine cyclotransferase [Planctomycetes bacterium RBG_13_46_10]